MKSKHLLRKTLACGLACFQIVLLADLALYAADNPEPYTIHPEYRYTSGVNCVPPENNGDLRRVLAAALGGDDRIDAATYYLVHRTVFNIVTLGLGDGGWYIYYAPWHQRQGALWWVSRLDDPLMGGNFRRKRIYGASQVHLVPIVYWPALNLNKHNDEIRADLGAQVADQVVASAGFQVTDALKSLNTNASITSLNDLLKARGASPVTASDYVKALGEAPARLDAVRKGPPPPSFQNVSVVQDASRLKTWKPKKGLTEDEADFVRAYAAWIVRETLSAYVQGSTTLMPNGQVIFVNGRGKKMPLSLREFEFEQGSETRYVPDGLPKEPKLAEFRPDYKVTVSAREPQPSSDFKGLIGLIGGAQAAVLTLSIDPAKKLFLPLLDTASTADEPMRIGVLPADVTVEALKPAATGQPKGGGAALAPPAPAGGAAPAPPAPAAPAPPAPGAPAPPAPAAPAPPAPVEGDAPAPPAPAGGAAAKTADSTAISSIKLIDEKKYAYGIGAGIPMKSLDTVDYDSTNGIITSKKVEKQNVFGFLLLHPYPTDTSGTRLRLMPAFMAGLPLAGKPLNQHIYAASLGLWKVEPFIGLHVNRSLVPAGGDPATTPIPEATAGSLKPRWGARLTFGIVVSISAVKSLISPKSGSAATTSAAAGGAAAGTPGSSTAKKK